MAEHFWDPSSHKFMLIIFFSNLFCKMYENNQVQFKYLRKRRQSLSYEH